MLCCITDIIIPIISALIGGFMSLLGVKVMLKSENATLKAERIEKLKPIIINYTLNNEKEKDFLPKYEFSSGKNDTCGNIVGIFKNTDNGIVFLDKIVGKNKEYFSLYNSTVDKNTAFIIEIHNIVGESLDKEFEIYCHDILGNRYCYAASYNKKLNAISDLLIGNIQKIEN